jgi:hypothetical protein
VVDDGTGRKNNTLNHRSVILILIPVPIRLPFLHLKHLHHSLDPIFLRRSHSQGLSAVDTYLEMEFISGGESFILILVTDP